MQFSSGSFRPGDTWTRYDSIRTRAAALRKKLGFSMSAMPARVSFDEKQKAYVASYISASRVRSEGACAAWIVTQGLRRSLWRRRIV